MNSYKLPNQREDFMAEPQSINTPQRLRPGGAKTQDLPLYYFSKITALFSKCRINFALTKTSLFINMGRDVLGGKIISLLLSARQTKFLQRSFYFVQITRMVIDLVERQREANYSRGSFASFFRVKN